MDHWHADETRWLVFVSLPDKSGHRWYLWAFQSAAVVVFVLDPGRAHDVPEEHLGAAATGILNVDRYSAYKALPQVKNGRILLAFCWAHQRRDFLGLAAAWPTEQEWAFGWVTAIGELYHLNDRRLEVREDSEAFQQRDQDLRAAVAAFQQRWEAAEAELPLHPARRKVLSSLREHWPGLTLFVEHPEIPMDNNTVERTLREPVVGRKNYAGMREALWSGQLLVQMLSLLATLKLWGLNPRLWLTAYLEACAQRWRMRYPAGPVDGCPGDLSEEQQRVWSKNAPGISRFDLTKRATNQEVAGRDKCPGHARREKVRSRNCARRGTPSLRVYRSHTMICQWPPTGRPTQGPIFVPIRAKMALIRGKRTSGRRPGRAA